MAYKRTHGGKLLLTPSTLKYVSVIIGCQTYNIAQCHAMLHDVAQCRTMSRKCYTMSFFTVQPTWLTYKGEEHHKSIGGMVNVIAINNTEIIHQ